MSQYPMAIYRPWFRRFFTFVIPLACINYFPGVAILGRPDPLGTPIPVLWLSPLAGPLFLLVALQIWRIGVRHYQSTGS
jgi:ABC-2 type transport system permease protein